MEMNEKRKSELEEAVDVIIELLQQCYPTENETQWYFEVDAKAECAGEDAIDFLEKLGRAKWLSRPRIAIVFKVRKR
ncbi:hypothetical protein DRP04_06070 [Archaeoglobales archaeon]|nr:MAG: hypothetical protein DRP04_06070 [Archaeoglobales archaeon]